MKLSAIILTSNDEDKIERCINSLQGIVDEIIIVDNYSTDYTAGIAQFLGAKVVLSSANDRVSQKNFAIERATNNWILFLNATEILSKELRFSIKTLEGKNEHDCYQFKRLKNYTGKWIKYCGWYPDKSIRLFDKNKGKWRRRKGKEYWKPFNANTVIGELKGDLLCYHINSVEDYLSEIDKCTDVLAQANIALGKSSSATRMWIAPVVSFTTNYFVKMGFLDGYEGYQICKISAYSTYLKYKKMKVMLDAKRQGRVN